MGGANQSSSASQSVQQNGLAVGHHTGPLPLAPSSVLPARPNLPDDPVIPHNGFPTIEEAEKAFMHLLRKAGVDANWTWDQTMRAIITDPLYKALNTLAEKKTGWEKYTNNLRAKEQEEKEARLAKLRPAIRNMLKGNPNVFHFTTFPTADKLFAQHPIWQQSRLEAERRMIFEEYVTELKQREVQESRAARARSVQKVMALFKQLDVDVVTRWRTAHQLVTDADEYKVDPELQKLPTLDILLAFEDYSRVREREYEEQMRRAQVEKTRKERKAREAFKGLLQNFIQEGKIKARSKWKEVYPVFRDDDRYLSILGIPGSNPLELFWDTVDTLDQQLDRKIAVVDDVFKNYGIVKDEEGGVSDKTKLRGFIVGPETTEGEFNSIMKDHEDENTKTLTEEDLHEVYKTLHDVAVKKQTDEKRRAERKQRHLQDDLRYAFKKLPEPLDITMSYEQIVSFIENLPEYKALEDEEGRRSAWGKYVKRQKEKLREAASEDGASTTSKKRKEPAREHRDERERDKEDKGREREKDRDREREKDREHRDRDRDRERDRDKARDYERDSRSSRHHHRYDDFDGHRSSRDYGRERDKDYERDKDRDGYRSSRHYRDDDRKREKNNHRDRKGSRSDYGPGYGRDWDEPVRRDEREQSSSVYGDEPRDRRDERHPDERAEKRAKLDHSDEQMEVDKTAPARAETPEEGEI
ncbi:hypothetical protein AX15_006472 [Amanita polypyramis BW_CC]|nr:hypothetical protein AX15_006472 [Amanita polypyramis BW_CC]